MRLHKLAMTAFGPYAGTEVVDFEELNEAGLFLLTGPTGAGKTSILDAVCYALYGVVPGERGVRSLRSHHAPDGLRPEVELEVTIGERRYRVRRTPEWTRPKKRGDGETKEHASACLIDLSEGRERLVSSRVAEVGHELGMALGMSSDQFMQVVMLPQGQFQTFLRATSDERQAVLERLFRTQRYSRIEEWVKDRSKALRAETARAERLVAQVLVTISNRAEIELPDHLATDPLGPVAAEAVSWAHAVLESAGAERRHAEVELAAAETTLDQAVATQAAAVAVAALLERRQKAERALAQLADSQEAAHADDERLAAHHRAAIVQPTLEPLEAAEASLLAATQQRCRVTVAAGSLLVGRLDHDRLDPDRLDPAGPDAGNALSRAALERALEEATRALLELRALQPRQDAMAEAERDLAELRGLLAVESSTMDRHSDRLRSLPAERSAVRDQAAQERSVASTQDASRILCEELEHRHACAVALVEARAHHDRCWDASQDLQHRVQAAGNAHLQLLERRLAGMAAELAGKLADGEPCQVCGSIDHPRPAEPRPDAVTEARQQQAQAEYDRLRSQAEAAKIELDAAATALQPLQAGAAGRTPEESSAELARARLALAAAAAAVSRAAELEQLDQRLTRELEEVDSALKESHARCSGLEVQVSTVTATVAATAREIESATGSVELSLEECIARHEEALTAVRHAVAADDAEQQARVRLDEARRHAEETARSLGFCDLDDVRTALLPPDAVTALREGARERELVRIGAEQVLAETEDALGAVGPQVSPDVEAAVRALTEARAAAQRWATTAAAAQECERALLLLERRLDEAVAAWEPLQREHALTHSVSELVRGMGTDNQLQMRLSSYVLATRLDQVVDAANGRLSAMRDQRYTLRRCATSAGQGRAGLGLEVLDDWTGDMRAPSTLSGGETFVVSLALALGLADVVTEESGGLRVDTLFVDEGFGMLDADTLDDVMDRIDALRAGGRTVGVVSHVSELRGRIPTQLHVNRGRAGSSVELRAVVMV